jgi:hypothetical protein
MGNGKPCPYEVRPPVRVTDKLKTEIMTSYGSAGSAGNYELDHLISLQLGGCTNCKENLWPEAYKPRPNAREKDAAETYLKRQVCNGAMTLDAAQKQITHDWYGVYKQQHSNH